VPFLLLQAVADMPEDALYRSLTHLQVAEFLYELTLFPERVHRFKHALTHEVAYGALLQERRRILHVQIAEVLEALAGDHMDDQVERLAHHALRGELWDKAFLYFRQAGAKAMARSANQEAVVCFEQALEAIQHLPDSPDTVAQGIDVRVDLRDALLPLGAYERIIDTLREAERLAEALDDPYRLGSVYVHMTHYFWSMRNLDRALVYGQRAIALAESLSDVSLYTSANFVLAEVHYHLGNYDQAIAAFEQNVALLTGDLLHERLGGVAVLSVVSRRWLVQSLAETGAFAEGITRGEEAVRIAEGADHPYSLANACYGLGYLYLHKGDAQKAVPLFAQAVELCQVWDFRQMVTGLTLFLSHALALAGRISEALAMVEQGTEPVALTSLLNRSPGHAFVLSEMHWQSGHHEDAQTLAVETCERAREHKERGHEANTLRLLGDIAIYRQPPEIDEAKTHYQQALNLAHELGMRPLQAHCHRGLSTLYSEIGRPEQARDELSKAIDMYREMEMTFWLPQAEVVLEQLKSS
jgi:tetratricopeptide (TPR) repeat protein